jgi:hypothetical protein
MNSQTGSPDKKNRHAADAADDAVLDQALRNFRLSVHAWSEAEYVKPRTLAIVRPTSWRMIAGWALGCVLAIGIVTGGLYEYRHRPQADARLSGAVPAVSQTMPAEPPHVLKENEDLLARIDSDVSRQVPSAMEPLAQLMSVDEAQ